jgi:hypothetical protein
MLRPELARMALSSRVSLLLARRRELRLVEQTHSR